MVISYADRALVARARRRSDNWAFLGFELAALATELSLGGVDRAEIDRRADLIIAAAYHGRIFNGWH